MSYALFDIKCHLMSNDAYDIKIWCFSIWPILVSKEASGPQQSHLVIRFWLKNCVNIKKLKSWSAIFSHYKFWESFVFLAFFQVKRGNPKTLPFKKIFVILCPELAIQWDKGGKQIVSKVLGKPGLRPKVTIQIHALNLFCSCLGWGGSTV